MAAPFPDGIPDRIRLPPPPGERRRREFPLLATAAPVLGALVMWAVTGSSFALVFALLGPVVAIGSMVDERRHGRRNSTAETLRFQNDVNAVLAKIRAAQEKECQALLRRVVQPHRIPPGSARDPEWWRQGWTEAIPVCVGFGPVPSSVLLESPPSSCSSDVGAAYAMLAAAAETIVDGPVLIDARDGMGIIGPRIPASALARSVVLQLALQLSPDESVVEAGDGGCFDWVGGLPHRNSPTGAHPDRVTFRPPAESGVPPVVCVVAEDASEVPRECRVLIRLDGTGTAVVERNPSAVTGGEFRPWFVSETTAAALAAVATACAVADGLAPAGDPLPETLSFSDLRPAEAKPNRLQSVFSVGASGAVMVDLVHDGPHAVIGGMTGSGKSELLVAWVLAMAAACSPAEVNFLLVDFKGGSSFAPVSRLPHTVGLITDLDEVGARRALTSLRAELRHRERVLAAAVAKSLDDLPAPDRLPRLVIMVDEFAVVVNDFPDLQALFADLAARGRSLGIHLVLCTQRPAGVIRDAVLSNCSLRLSLRVNNAADSAAVIGSAAAAELPAGPRGRCLLSISGAAPIAVQVALATAADADAVIARYEGTPVVVRRPWRDPLGPNVSLEDAIAARDRPGLAFGLADIPEQQSQPAAVFDPEADGNLVVLGGLGSGKSGVLAALQAAAERDQRPAVRIPNDIEAAWDAVTEAVAKPAVTGRVPVLYLLDDVDILLGQFSSDHQPAFIELMTRLLREGSRTVFAAARLTPGIQSLVAACDSRIILRMPNRQEHLLAGGEPSDYSADLVPGSGNWRGHRVQVARSAVAQVAPVGRTPWPVPPGRSFTLVVPGAGAIADRLREADSAADAPGLRVIDITHHGESSDGTSVSSLAAAQPHVVVGDPQAWQARWSLFAALRESGPVVFTGCSVAEFRSLTGMRQLAPPIGPRPGGAWMLSGDGTVRRVQLPEWFPDWPGTA